MTSCSNRKTLLSFIRPSRPPSGSDTMNVSCSKRRPWATIFPWRQRERNVNALFKEDVVLLDRSLRKMASYIKPLKPADIHHIVTPFWNNAHDLHCFLEESEINNIGIIAQTVLHNFFFKFMFCVAFLFGDFLGSHFQIRRLEPSLFRVFQEILKCTNKHK